MNKSKHIVVAGDIEDEVRPTAQKVGKPKLKYSLWKITVTANTAATATNRAKFKKAVRDVFFKRTVELFSGVIIEKVRIKGKFQMAPKTGVPVKSPRSLAHASRSDRPFSLGRTEHD